MRTNVQVLTMVRTLALAALAFLAQACVTSPYNGQLVTDIGGPVTIAGFFHQPNVPLTIEVAHPATGAWEVLSTTSSAATPTLAAGTWKNSPPLYSYSTTVQVYDPDDPQTLQRWGSGASYGVTTLVATLRVRSGDFPLYTGQEHSVSCVTQNASQTEDFYTTASNCGFQQTTVWIQSFWPVGSAWCKHLLYRCTHHPDPNNVYCAEWLRIC